MSSVQGSCLNLTGKRGTGKDDLESHKRKKKASEVNIVQLATRPDDSEQTKKALANKFLGLCLADYGGGSSLSYLILLMKADGLFDKQPRFKTRRVEFPVDSKAGNWFGMGCAISGTDLYLVGGQKTENTSSDSSSDSDSDSCGYSSEVFRVRLDCRQKTDIPKSLQLDMICEKASPMLSEIASPLIIPVGKKLYMLAGPPLSMMPDYPFQVYDPEKEPTTTKPWKELESPPFLDLYSKYFQDPQIRSYVVFENKIHVSTSSFSFTFDTTAEKWLPCTLFDDPSEKVKRWIEIQNPTEYGWMTYPPNSNKEPCGRPFEFDGGAVNFELKPHRIIICLALFPLREVVAYKFVDGKAPDKQVLRRQEDLDIPPDATAYLADFQNGCLCLLTVSNDHQLKQDCQISITPFEVSKLEPGERSNFLKCTWWGEKITLKRSSAEQSLIGTPIGSFVMDVELSGTSTSAEQSLIGTPIGSFVMDVELSGTSS